MKDLSNACVQSILIHNSISSHQFDLFIQQSYELEEDHCRNKEQRGLRQGISRPERARDVRDEKHQCKPRGLDPRCGVRFLREADGHLFLGPEGEGVGPAGERGVGLLC